MSISATAPINKKVILVMAWWHVLNDHPISESLGGMIISNKTVKATDILRGDIAVMNRVDAGLKLDGYEFIITQIFQGIGCRVHEQVLCVLCAPANRVTPGSSAQLVVRW